MSTTSAPPIKHTHSRCCLNYSAHTHTHTHTKLSIASTAAPPTGIPPAVATPFRSTSLQTLFLGRAEARVCTSTPARARTSANSKRERTTFVSSPSLCVRVCVCVCVCVREGLFIEKSPRAKEGEHWVPSHGSNIISNNSIRPFISSIDIILLPGSHIRL